MDPDAFVDSLIVFIARTGVIAFTAIVLIGPGALLLWAGYVAYAIPSLMAGVGLLVFAIVSALQHAGCFR